MNWHTSNIFKVMSLVDNPKKFSSHLKDTRIPSYYFWKLVSNGKNQIFMQTFYTKKENVTKGRPRVDIGKL